MSPPSKQPRSVHVLAVDDCDTMRAILQSALEALGYSVQAADSGQAALDLAGGGNFDAIILDVEMPGLDGMAVGRALRSDPKTASAMIAMHSSIAEDAVRAGFSQYDAFLPKPCSPQALGQRLDGLIRSRVPARSLPPDQHPGA